MPTGVPFSTPSDLSAFASFVVSRWRSAKVTSRRSSAGSPSQWNATLAPLPASTCRSTQLYVALSLPPTNHFAYGRFHSQTVSNGSNHVTRSRASVLPELVAAPVVDLRLRVRLRGELLGRRIAPLLEEQRVDRLRLAGSLRLEVVRVLRQVLRAVVGDEDEILEAAAAPAPAVEARLERHDVAREQSSSPARASPGCSCTSRPTPWPSEWK